MSNPTTINNTATEADKLLKALESVLVPIAETAIETAVPALGLPVIKQITQAIEQALANKITALLEMGVTFEIIDVQTGEEQSNVSDALKNLIAAEKTNNQAAIALAVQAYQNYCAALVHDDGSADPQ